MPINHGFHAAMTARPGKGDELVEGWATPEAHRRFFATAEAQPLVAQLQPLLDGEPAYTDEMPIGGKAAV
ncbi:hypothetical protein [Paractinoplanes toevensis]|uniref:Uncharacterized protein n=1 Tax=Paractinoplanes toevensis TaxID=571911 RepID=A0A919T6H2_9ACTN|nr:hypothetical protein [Actinoplanes toevensis]GIM90053.1 hypothetical protein Ato02nite_018460 [Actinoplanes toevensis]